jgi:hypothetical protein
MAKRRHSERRGGTVSTGAVEGRRLPPGDSPHRYRFTLYALNARSPTARAKSFEAKIDTHLLGTARLVEALSAPARARTLTVLSIVPCRRP